MCKGYVYFITSSKDTNMVKVGFSKNPLQRLRQLQTANSNTLKILHVIKCNTFCPKAVENRVHHILKFDSVKGEWFKPSPDKLQWLCTFNTDEELYGLNIKE